MTFDDHKHCHVGRCCLSALKSGGCSITVLAVVTTAVALTKYLSSETFCHVIFTLM